MPNAASTVPHMEPRDELAIEIATDLSTLEKDIEEWKAGDRSDYDEWNRLNYTISNLNNEVNELEHLEHIHEGGLIS